MKMENVRRISIGAGGVFAVLFSVFVAYLMISGYVGNTVVENVVYRKELKPLVVLPVGDASLGDGATKVMYWMHYPYQVNTSSSYSVNLSNDSAAGGAYEFYDYLDNEMTNETPYGTAFDIVIKMGINTNHGYNSSSSAWELTLFNATLKGETGLGFTTDVAMNETVIGSDANWYYVHFYIQDADGGVGSGFSIAQGVKTNATFEFWCYQ